MSRSMVVAPQSEAAEVALGVLEAGGNAFDAAVAGAFTQGVVDPHRSGIGGFGAAILYSAAERSVWSVTYFGRAGSRARPDMWESILEGPAPDGFGYILAGKVNDVGYQSITVPGMVGGVGEIHERFGVLPWSDLVRRAAEVARRGFIVVPSLAAFWRRPGLFGRVSTRERLGVTADGRALWLASGEPPQGGDVVRQEMLAATYEMLADRGPRDFYTGEIGDRIAADWEANGALVTREDLASYRVLWEEPLYGRAFDRDLLTTPLPGGGVALFQTLRLAELLGLFEERLNSAAYVDGLARVLSCVQDDRTRFHADPAFGGMTAEELLADGRLRELAGRVGGAGAAESPDTTEIIAADEWGNAIALCHSLGYGSGVFTPGLGFMHNNCMSGFDPRPESLNAIAPGKARGTAIAQTIVMDGADPVLILGSPGGSRITAGLAEVLINYLRFGLDLQDAISRPRFDAYQRTLILESRMPFTLEDRLAGRWEFKRSPNPFGMIGRVYGIAFTDRGLKPGYDPGEPGTAREL